jgi:glycosyltransferase involved in cell wall biosynthesis
MGAYDEEASVAEVVRGLAAVLRQSPGKHEIIVVNDGSTDRTAEVLETLTDEVPELVVIHHERNRGLAQVQRTGIAAATGDAIAHFPADGEIPPQACADLIATLREGFDIVVGVRSSKQYSPYRSLASWSYNRLAALLFGVDFRDLGGIRIARAALWKSVPAPSQSATASLERLVMAHRAGARIGFVDVEHRWRKAGRSAFSHPTVALRMLRDLLVFRVSLAGRAGRDPGRTT